MLNNKTVLIVDDEVNICELIRLYVEKEGCKAVVAYDGNQAIDKLCSGGKIVLCGVSNDNAPINTRMVLEHGLTLMGTTRSVRCDFEKAVELLQIPEFRERILRLVDGIDVVDNINKYYKAFDEASKSQSLGKRIIKLVF